MKTKSIFIIAMVTIYALGLNAQKVSNISPSQINQIASKLEDKHGYRAKFRIEKGVRQAAALWQSKDGDAKAFEEFCLENFISKEDELTIFFNRLQQNFELLYGHYNRISIDLKRPVHQEDYDILPIDYAFSAYDPFAHLKDDFFDNKIAFAIVLNFPFYTLAEKQIAGEKWSPKEWGYARVGDVFTSRIPATVSQNISEKSAVGDTYIANYNICMDKVFDNTGKFLFPKDLKLITHWGLRDELKSHYGGGASGLEKQKIIYNIMKRIITQTIPSEVINSDKYTWNPYTNKVFDNATEIITKPEPDTRYKVMLDLFHAMKEADAYSPHYPTYISQKFDQEMEMSQKEVEEMFITFVSAPEVAKVGKLIEKRLGRKLQAFDIWYDGFKSRSSISQEDLDRMVFEKYPTKGAFEAALPSILVKLGFSQEKADFICSKIEVNPSRGAGHAWGSMMKDDVSHLRTRVGKNGMDYKGYNIAVHEFGHNVEQTISLHWVDNYFMNGVPNTAFTEALAFVFQTRDLQLLGKETKDPLEKHLMALDIFWGCYEIMGVSLVDMNVWKWLYENPNATPEQLKNQVNKIAVEVWNKYYAPVFGVKDELILAVYSHMIVSPLYLSAYPIGHLIQFQLEKHLEGKNIGEETLRIFAQGRLHPQLWMQKAVGQPLSVQPLLKSTAEALSVVKQ